MLLQLSPGARVSGRVIFEGGAPALVAATSVFLDRVDQRPLRLGPARPDRAGQFTTTDFPPGKYRLRVGVIPAGWMFKSAMYEGRDIADEPFDLESADVKGVVVTFTTRGTRLSGAVRSERGRPDPETSVLLIPPVHPRGPTVSIFRMRQDPKRLAELASRATRVRIADGQTLVQDLTTVRHP